jgi:phenylalanyl-tRNA synthetase beta chain
MRLSTAWLSDFVPAAPSAAELARQLTMAGLEVAAVQPAAHDLSGIVAARIVAVGAHPEADKLSVCTVEAGTETRLQVVCGAPNARAGLIAPLATVGSSLADGTVVAAAEIRGVASEGMLCSQKELGLSDDHSGLWELPADVDPGAPLTSVLGLPDTVLELELTPNRGDCLSVLGLAREVAALTGSALVVPERTPVAPVSEDSLPVTLEAREGCPVYVGRIVRGVANDARTPLWMTERLRRSGLRPLHPVVDVTNYVMLEMGQPMHAFDLATLARGIVVRWARPGERLTLLDGREVTLEADVLTIADHERIRALAGVMGGADSGVTEATRDVFLESAFFTPKAIAGRARRFALHTDASQRFERGVDPAIQEAAMERATRLLVEIAGGEAGPCIVASAPECLPLREPVNLRPVRIERVLGVEVADERVEQVLEGLGMSLQRNESGWRVQPPSFRFDIGLEEDLIEEVARVIGYDEIAEEVASAAVPMPALPEDRMPVSRARQVLIDRGYSEVVTYSFIDAASHALFAPGEPTVNLANPIAEDLAQMRRSLWPGLCRAARENFSRQQTRVRIFECGMKFMPQGDDIQEIEVIAGLSAGALYEPQWGLPSRPGDFFDIKGDLEAILRQTGRIEDVTWNRAPHPALHPGRSARVFVADTAVGWVGQLHPRVAAALDLGADAFVFEIETPEGLSANLPRSAPISRYPATRRDIAVVVPEAVTVAELIGAAEEAAGELAQSVFLFDIYRGEGIDSGLKSIALGLNLQEYSRTLTVADADDTVAAVVARLERDFKAKIRV